MQQVSIGDFELTSFSDGIYHLDGGAYFGVVPKVLWQQRVEVDEKNRVPTGLNSVIIRTGDKTVLIETGVGNKLPEKMAKIYGQPAELLHNLGAAGISPEDIDVVINTHLHFDHCGWNTQRTEKGIVPTFPKAIYYVQEGEWQHAHQGQRDAVSYISENYDPRNFGQSFSRTHKRHAGCNREERQTDCLLHLRSHPDQRAYRIELGYGIRSVSTANY
jgi:glyoxylase-like metal-dependent hydrolase (beta-lactamase superfamily II)